MDWKPAAANANCMITYTKYPARRDGIHMAPAQRSTTSANHSKRKSIVYEDATYATFYDWVYSSFTNDVEWYLALARSHGAPVLEVACGTGRVAVPLARAGFDVTGIDLSEAMLDIARRKLESEPSDVRGRVSLAHGDMREFALGRAFPCVIVPNAALLNLLRPLDVQDCLCHLFLHTRAGGLVAIDLVAPRRITEQPLNTPLQLGDGVNPLTGLPSKAFTRLTRLDRRHQLVRIEHFLMAGKTPGEHVHSFTQDCRWLEPDEAVRLLEHAGFIDVRLFGDYQGGAFRDDSERLVLTGRRQGD